MRSVGHPIKFWDSRNTIFLDKRPRYWNDSIRGEVDFKSIFNSKSKFDLHSIAWPQNLTLVFKFFCNSGVSKVNRRLTHLNYFLLVKKSKYSHLELITDYLVLLAKRLNIWKTGIKYLITIRAKNCSWKSSYWKTMLAEKTTLE